ncbi:MAG: DegT/DnrJ/EryC1/StrS family aminotransferase [Victivallales bacterium]
MLRVGNTELKELEKSLKSKKLFRVGDIEKELCQVLNFEKEWAEKIGTRHALLVSGGGTGALVAALVGVGIGPGDEVIVPAYTFMATASAVLIAGAIPVLAEIDESLALSPEDFEKKITKDTKAVMPVHMIGRPANLDKIIAIAKKHSIKVVEDSCQCDGGSYKGRRTGSLGDAGAYSFNDFKILSCGEGGGMVTNDSTAYERAAIFADSGTAFRPYAGDIKSPIFLGQQLRASEPMGAILRGQLGLLEGILADARKIAGRIRKELDGCKGLKLAPMNEVEGDCGISVAFTFKTEVLARKFAKAEGVGAWLPIDTGKHVYTNWEPILKKQVYHHPAMNPFNFAENKNLRHNYTNGMCPKTLDICNRTAILSINPDMTEETVSKRIAACKAAADTL